MRSGHLVVETSAENHLHMALLCAAELHSLGLAGPLFIGGKCQGALLAQKIAQLLMTSGRAVSLLIGLNPFLFEPYPGRAAFILERYDLTNPLHRFHDAEAVLRANLPHCTIDTLPSGRERAVSGVIPARAARGNGPARSQRRANITTLPNSVSPRPRNAPGVQWKPS